MWVTTPDCRKCGLCCVSPYDQDAFCDLGWEDEQRIGLSWVRRNVVRYSFSERLAAAFQGEELPPGAIRTRWKPVKAGPLKGGKACACVALRGSILHQVSCSIYERRPRACREAVVPGDKVCQEIRREYQEGVNHG